MEILKVSAKFCVCGQNTKKILTSLDKIFGKLTFSEFLQTFSGTDASSLKVYIPFDDNSNKSFKFFSKIFSLHLHEQNILSRILMETDWQCYSEISQTRPMKFFARRGNFPSERLKHYRGPPASKSEGVKATQIQNSNFRLIGVKFAFAGSRKEE